MSLWFRGRSRGGKIHYYSVSIPWFFILMTLVAVVVALLLPWII
jgi:hypothetical protein